jgi:hypothetical protein
MFEYEFEFTEIVKYINSVSGMSITVKIIIFYSVYEIYLPYR